MKMIALKDFLHPHESKIYVVGSTFDLEDADLAEYLVGMGTLEYDTSTPEPISAKPAPAPTKAQLSSGG